MNDARYNWIHEFGKKVRPRLREIFEKDLNSPPREITERFERLRQVERKLLKSDEK